MRFVAPPLLSVVIPVYNEAAVVRPLFARLLPVLRVLGGRCEIVVVDDGSTDRTWTELRARAAAARSVAVRLIRLSRNFGQQAAISAGLVRATGRAVAVMDADLQDPPELLPKFLQRWRGGAEVVYGIRASRREGWLKRAAYKAYYRLLNRLSLVPIPLDAGDFCLMDRRVVDLLCGLPERNRFLRGLRGWVGFRQVGVPYDRPARAGGRPAYSFPKLVRLGVDGIASFSYVPLRLSAVLGFVVAASGVGFALFAVAARVAGTTAIPAGWASLVVLGCVIGGTQLIVLGIMGEYLARVYDEAKQRPAWVVRDTVAKG